MIRGQQPHHGKSLSRPFPSTNILGIRVDRVSLPELLVYIRTSANAAGSVSVLYLNPHIWNLASNNPDLKKALDCADVVWCDGIGVLLAARILGQPLPERMTVPDFIDDLCRYCVHDDRSLFLLGGEEGVARKAGETLRQRHPGLRLVGTHHGFLTQPEVSASVKAEIQRMAPDFLLAGMGSPQQELWITRNLAELNVRVAWAVGALFDILAGKVRRAPQWASRSGLEWLHRLFVEPQRLWRRYLFGNARFVSTVLAARICRTGRRVP